MISELEVAGGAFLELLYSLMNICPIVPADSPMAKAIRQGFPGNYQC